MESSDMLGILILLPLCNHQSQPQSPVGARHLLVSAQLPVAATCFVVPNLQSGPEDRSKHPELIRFPLPRPSRSESDRDNHVSNLKCDLLQRMVVQAICACSY
ncbi:hypothetical protein CROQUDRAFT_94109 [Cronartium quercuum f. sp. fusiforme G11]|uniref:Uncharacterized protein n=1 Tax=Cronartium quercuum f. sp. fusiforme G11 TaxID=708437 RepID=A0A9P6TC40_9BASI|nr:hypothetical protein CROQUDRAFT_94109 [Cronartium quercuum f. sp. fusiforme G11]